MKCYDDSVQLKEAGCQRQKTWQLKTWQLIHNLATYMYHFLLLKLSWIRTLPSCALGARVCREAIRGWSRCIEVSSIHTLDQSVNHDVSIASNTVQINPWTYIIVIRADNKKHFWEKIIDTNIHCLIWTISHALTWRGLDLWPVLIYTAHGYSIEYCLSTFSNIL